MTAVRKAMALEASQPIVQGRSRVSSFRGTRDAEPNADYKSVSAIVRWMFYFFVFSLPFEYPGRKIPIELSTPAASIYLLFTLFDVKACYSRPPKVLWWLVAHVVIYATLTGFSVHPGPAIEQTLRLTQIVLLVWTGYNLMRYDRIANTALAMYALGCGGIALMRVLGIATTTVYDSWYDTSRTTVLGQNPNNLANNLSLGLIALLGLVASRNKNLSWYRYLLLPFALLLAKTIVDSGSRGGILALAAGLVVLAFGGKTFWTVVRNLAIGAAAMALLVVLISHSTVESRLERAEEGHLTGRELIYPTAWEMFKEKPITGWGPSDNTYELGKRIPHRPEDDTRDFHNLALSILTSTGIVGAIPLFICLGVCIFAALKSYKSDQGIIPLAVTAAIVVINTAGDWSASKLDWLLLFYGVASASTVVSRKLRQVPFPRGPRWVGAYPHRPGPIHIGAVRH